MRIFRTTIAAFCAALTLLLLSSCDHKELCFHHPHAQDLEIVIDWRDAPQANPSGMVVFFYPIEGQVEEYEGYTRPDVIRTDLSKTGGKVRGITPGKYRVITYNNDTDGILFADLNNFDNHLGYTREGSVLEPLYGNASNRAPKAQGAEDERVVICPDPMWGCSVMEVEVTEQGVSYIHYPFDPDADMTVTEPIVTHHVITLYPHPLFCYYTYEIRNVTNIENALQQTATLSGMAPALYFGSEDMHRERVTLPFAAVANISAKTITGEFYTWGHHELNPEAHKLVLYIWMRGEPKGWYYTWDVTDQVHAAPDRHRVHLIIDGLELPQIIGGGESNPVDPSIDDFIDEEHQVVM